MTTPRLESNPWFHYFIARKTYLEPQMVAIAMNTESAIKDFPLKGRDLFVSIAAERCPFGHIKNWHPFAKQYMCHSCNVNNFVARMNENPELANAIRDAFVKKDEESPNNEDQRGHVSDEDVTSSANNGSQPWVLTH